MKDIVAKTIGNDVGQICDAVMSQIIPAINAQNDEIRKLQGQLAALGAPAPATKPAPKPAPAAKPKAAPKKKATRKT